MGRLSPSAAAPSTVRRIAPQHSSLIQLVYGKTRFVAASRCGESRNQTMLRSVRAFDPARRGLLMLYHAGEVNHCPGCGRTHWYVGRLSAECGFCGTALALAETGMTGVGLFRHPPEAAFEEAA
jgi:hypothetical protein